MLSDDWVVFIDFYPRFMQVYRRVVKTSWFQQGQWTAFIGHYTHGIFMQMSKPHWYNYEFDGIHFELAIDKPSAEQQLASIQLHITHKSVLPDREAFNAYTIPRMLEMVEAWDRRYELSPSRPSERLNCTIPFTTTTFAPRVAEALTQACQLDTIIDEALQTLWP
ncbi:MAG: hypothetical protein DCC55_15430 [Chloroflexi bacterium]|nr:MAG: hypothetical protein DCC55_15430 [Chloroflexota bacterium]